MDQYPPAKTGLPVCQLGQKCSSPRTDSSYWTVIIVGWAKGVAGRKRGASRSGRTSYVELAALAPPTDELVAVVATMAREETAVLARLTESVAAAALLRRACAAGDGRSHGSGRRRSNPAGGARGPDGWHCPPRALPQSLPEDDCVGHDLLLGHDSVSSCGVIGETADEPRGKNRGLVLTGPNAGGKALALQAFGLVAFLARLGVPLCQHDEPWRPGTMPCSFASGRSPPLSP